MARAATEDVSRLPQWAQRRIKTLEMRLHEAGARESAGPEDSNTFANPHLGLYDKFRNPTPLGSGTSIRFRVDERRDFTVRLDDGELYVMGSGGTMIRPQSSNTFRVRCER